MNTLAAYIDQISTTPDIPLLFSLDGVKIGNGYHVTEIKLAEVKSVDCGKSSDNWQEVIVQLLDGASSEPAITCAQFQKIMTLAQLRLHASNNAVLLFEFSPANGTLHRLQVRAIVNHADAIIVELEGTKAECKPFTRAMVNTSNSIIPGAQLMQSSCCGGSTRPSPRSCC